METKVFLIEEHAEAIFDSEKNQEWLNLVKELGLTCQETLIQEKKSPIPFPIMTEAEAEILATVLDSHVPYNKFEGEAIPLPCLSAIALCEKEHYFEKIEIWYSRSNPDPVVVGKNYQNDYARTKKYDWQMNVFKIAQWGAKLKPLIDLLPLWNKTKSEEIEQAYQYNKQQHEGKVKKFQFQINAFAQ